MARWTSIKGEGVVYEGTCLVKTVIVVPSSSKRWVKIWDGRDADSGKLFGQFHPSGTGTEVYSFGLGVFFDRGIYVTVENSDNVTTVIFEPVSE